LNVCHSGLIEGAYALLQAKLTGVATAPATAADFLRKDLLPASCGFIFYLLTTTFTHLNVSQLLEQLNIKELTLVLKVGYSAPGVLAFAHRTVR
jgi:hypothetical protein